MRAIDESDRRPVSQHRIETGALAFLPGAVFELVPELHDYEQRGLTTEAIADCERCVKLPERYPGGFDHPWASNPETRCCTYHPRLPSYLIGRALLRGGSSAERMRARLADPTGVDPLGIAPSDAYEANKQRSTLAWGRDRDLRCPFWVGGTFGCGIWKDRNGVCRTWFCKHDGGVVALVRWNALRQVLTRVERALAELCVERASADHPPGTDEAWFVWCSREVERLQPADLEPLRTAALDRVRRQLSTRRSPTGPAMAEVLVPGPRDAFVHRGRVALEGYSNYDGVDAPAEILDLFSRLDGTRPWRDALAETRSSGGGDAVTEDLVRELVRTDVLRDPARVRTEAAEDGKPAPPGADAVVPEVLVPATRKPITIGPSVWLQGDPGLASVVAPTSIFRVLSRLDGRTRWRDALAVAAAECEQSGEPVIAGELVIALYRIGALQAA